MVSSVRIVETGLIAFFSPTEHGRPVNRPFALNESARLEKMTHAPIHQNLEKDFKRCEG